MDELYVVSLHLVEVLQSIIILLSMNRLIWHSADCGVCVTGKNGPRCRDSFLPCLVAFGGFHPYLYFFFHLKTFLYLLLFNTLRAEKLMTLLRGIDKTLFLNLLLVYYLFIESSQQLQRWQYIPCNTSPWSMHIFPLYVLHYTTWPWF